MQFVPVCIFWLIRVANPAGYKDVFTRDRFLLVFFATKQTYLDTSQDGRWILLHPLSAPWFMFWETNIYMCHYIRGQSRRQPRTFGTNFRSFLMHRGIPTRTDSYCLCVCVCVCVRACVRARACGCGCGLVGGWLGVCYSVCWRKSWNVIKSFVKMGS